MNWCSYCNQWFFGLHYHTLAPAYAMYYWPPEVAKITYLENRIMYLEQRVQELERKAAPPASLAKAEAQESLDESALAAAEKTYWTDNGVSRHNLAAAIRTYQRVAAKS